MSALSPRSTVLADQTWDRVSGTGLLLIPLGSTEQHGPHLPLSTDADIASAVAHRAADRLPNALVAPTLPYGASGEHAGFAGTLSIGTDALTTVVIELARSARANFAGATGEPELHVVFVNGHGGNAEGLQAAVTQLRHENHSVSQWSIRVPGGDAHAGHTETSLLLELCPDRVDLDRAAAGATAPLTSLIGELRDHGVIGVSPNGVLGDPAGASSAIGGQLLVALTEDLIAHATGAMTAGGPSSESLR